MANNIPPGLDPVGVKIVLSGNWGPQEQERYNKWLENKNSNPAGVPAGLDPVGVKYALRGNSWGRGDQRRYDKWEREQEKIQELITGRADYGPAYYEDGVITYKVDHRNDDFHKAFRKLEKELGIETKRVTDWRKADIICNYEDDLGNYAGVHKYKRDKNGRAYSKIEVVEDEWWSQSTVVHEIGHALGMAHPRDMSREDTIMSYGAPGDLPWFTKLDEKVLDYLYN